MFIKKLFIVVLVMGYSRSVVVELGNKLLRTAVRKGSIGEVKELVEHASDEDKSLALVIAAEKQKFDTAQVLLSLEGTNINGVDQHGYTAFDYFLASALRPNCKEAQVEGCVALMASLINKGYKIPENKEAKNRILLLAAMQGHLELIEELYNAGADVNSNFFLYGTPLNVAREKGHTDVCNALTRMGAKG
jgi:ankyrin repeat protein